MHNFIKAPPGTSLLELLQAKYELPPVGISPSCCGSCLKPFSGKRKVCGYLRTTPAHLQLPVIFQYPLCKTCADQLRQGGDKEASILAAVEKFMNREDQQ